jgi:hypothetical protein
VEVACEQRDLQDVGSLRARGQVPHLHVLAHSLTKGCHGKLLRKMELVAPTAAPSSRKRKFRGKIPTEAVVRRAG